MAEDGVSGGTAWNAQTQVQNHTRHLQVRLTSLISIYVDYLEQRGLFEGTLISKVILLKFSLTWRENYLHFVQFETTHFHILMFNP